MGYKFEEIWVNHLTLSAYLSNKVLYWLPGNSLRGVKNNFKLGILLEGI
jgi:hypothetical protein